MTPTTQSSFEMTEFDRLPLYTETRQHIDECKSLAFAMHHNGQRQAEIEQQKTKIVTRFLLEVNSDKTLSNAEKRKTALAQKLDKDEAYQDFERQALALKNDTSIMDIELRYQRDLIKLNVAFIEAR